MMNSKIYEIRERRDAWKTFSRIDWGERKMIRIESWEGQYVIPLSEIRLTAEPQRVTIIDVTAYYKEIAKFSGSWPEQGPIDQAVVTLPDEGNIGILTNDGCQIYAYISETMIRVVSGTEEDFTNLAEEMDDELQGFVDAGGSVLQF